MSAYGDVKMVIKESQSIAAAMRRTAMEVGVSGVSEVLTVAQVFAYLEIAGVTERELEHYRRLRLTELVVSLTGTGLVYACLAPLVDIVGTFQRKPDYENRGIDDAGTNYFGFATGKLAQSIRTDADSSHAEVRRGESGAPGALIRQRIATAFSGGTIEQDIMIAQAGIDQFERLPVTREFVSSLTIDEHDTVVLDYLKRRGYFSSLLRNGMLGTLTDRVRTRAREQSLTPLDLDQAVELYWPEDIAGVLEKYKKIAPAGK